MRRGLLAWDEEEVPVAVLDSRVARCQAAMAEDGHEALLVYTNFPRPAAVSWLTHFVPYWSQGVLLVPSAGLPVFFVSLSKRVAGWIDETSRMGEIVSTPRLGADLAARLDGSTRVGVVEMAKLPGGIARPLVAALPDADFADATALFRRVRNPADAVEIALARQATALAREVMVPSDAADSGALVSAIEGAARRRGAEEVLVELAPDLDAEATLRRIDGVVPLGPRHAVRLSLAYKGHWVRVGRTFGPDRDDEIDDWLVGALPRIADGTGRPRPGDGPEIDSVTVEACTGTLPLAAVAGAVPGAVASVSLQLRLGGRPYLASEPVLLATTAGGSAERLLDP